MTTEPNAGGAADDRLADHDRDVEQLLGSRTPDPVRHPGPAERDLLLGEFLSRARPARRPSGHGGDRIGDALRRISANVGAFHRYDHDRPAWWYEYTQARLQLDLMARQAIAGPTAIKLMARFADRDEHDPYEVQARNAVFSEEDLDTEISGALLFGYLLHLAGHPVSASFWWKIAAGAGDRDAAYAMHLHHLKRGETADAVQWYLESCATPEGGGGPVPPSTPRVAGYHRAVPALAEQRPRRQECSAEVIAEMVNSLVVCGDSARSDDDAGQFDGIAERPDRRLAPQLADLAGRC
ncbi:hypothetical protein ACIRBX_33685 [Kitasatospora sp. NPDC096147]|uniref:hypothetical protein n=1 Tax=Kitasatospora sp. NPDC096147 TaxID=3364093 RepID=UPI00382959BE